MHRVGPVSVTYEAAYCKIFPPIGMKMKPLQAQLSFLAALSSITTHLESAGSMQSGATSETSRL
jgi:hypothetical protein